MAKYGTGDDPNFPEPIELDQEATISDLEHGVAYRSEVNNVVPELGVFVTLREYPDQISGLVHVSKLPPLTNVNDYSAGDVVIVELQVVQDNGDLGFNGLKAPGIAPDAPPESVNTNKDGSVSETNSPGFQDVLTEINKRLQNLEQGNQPATAESELDIVTQPVDNAISTLSALQSGGYQIDQYTQDVVGAGREIEISITMKRKENTK